MLQKNLIIQCERQNAIREDTLIFDLNNSFFRKKITVFQYFQHVREKRLIKFCVLPEFLMINISNSKFQVSPSLKLVLCNETGAEVCYDLQMMITKRGDSYIPVVLCASE